MKIGYIGLGKMGLNMVKRLLEKDYRVVAFDTNKDAVQTIAGQGAEPSESLASLVQMLPRPRLVWLMLPHMVVDNIITGLLPSLAEGDTIVDGGNSHYKESIRRARDLNKEGIAFLDAGVSGGPKGARSGACIMVGGNKEVFQKYEKLFQDLSVENGYSYMGNAGAGHFVKMVHNGIEYGMMQAIAEGFALMKSSPLSLDLIKVAEVYNHRSDIESRLIGWLKEALDRHGEALGEIAGSVEYTGEAGWTIETAKELRVPVPVIDKALSFRVASHRAPSYTGQLLSAMRHQFGGHEVFKKGDK
jgi:6-phosphogluconate dehydrogenase